MPIDFAALFATLPECPAPAPVPLATVCGLELGWEVHLRPTSFEPVNVRLGPCGTYLTADQVLTPCVFVALRHYTEAGVSSEVVEGSSNPECQPVPEPALPIALALGGLVLALTPRLRRSSRGSQARARP